MFVSAGFSFIDPFKVERIIIELNGTTNYSISCRTTDLNATTTLFHYDKEIPVGGRVTLDKQVYTIHGILLRDSGAYKCKARDSSGSAVIQQRSVVIHTIVKGKFIDTCLTQKLFC